MFMHNKLIRCDFYDCDNVKMNATVSLNFMSFLARIECSLNSVQIL